MRNFSPRSSRESIDLGVYPKSLFLMLRNPIIMLGPLLSSLVNAVIDMVGQGSQNMIGVGTITQLIHVAVSVFGVALATVVADMVWRRGKTSFDEAWEQSRRKGSDIIFAGLGLSMLCFVAAYLGQIIGGPLPLILPALALATFIYSIPAAAIGGVPGGLSLQASLDMTKSRPINTIILGIVMLVTYFGIGLILPQEYLGPFIPGAYLIIVIALCQAIAVGFIATCLAKRYADASFRNM